MNDNRCPGVGVEGHEGHHSFCVQCIEGVPEERPNETHAKWLDLDVDDPWVDQIL